MSLIRLGVLGGQYAFFGIDFEGPERRSRTALSFPSLAEPCHSPGQPLQTSLNIAKTRLLWQKPNRARNPPHPMQTGPRVNRCQVQYIFRFLPGSSRFLGPIHISLPSLLLSCSHSPTLPTRRIPSLSAASNEGWRQLTTLYRQRRTIKHSASERDILPYTPPCWCRRPSNHPAWVAAGLQCRTERYFSGAERRLLRERA